VWALASLVIAIGVVIIWLRIPRLHRPTTSTVPAIRVAVARFDNETGDAGFDRFADALTDAVTARLTAGSTGRYGVIGNAAILRVPRSQRDLVAIASSLHAGYVVIAQVRPDASRCSVLAHLIHLPEQTHVAVTMLKCPAADLVQTPSILGDQIADKFSPLIKQ